MLSTQQTRNRSGLPLNTGFLFVPQQEAWVAERFGKFHKVLEPVCVMMVMMIAVMMMVVVMLMMMSVFEKCVISAI